MAYDSKTNGTYIQDHTGDNLNTLKTDFGTSNNGNNIIAASAGVTKSWAAKFNNTSPSKDNRSPSPTTVNGSSFTFLNTYWEYNNTNKYKFSNGNYSAYNTTNSFTVSSMTFHYEVSLEFQTIAVTFVRFDDIIGPSSNLNLKIFRKTPTNYKTVTVGTLKTAEADISPTAGSSTFTRANCTADTTVSLPAGTHYGNTLLWHPTKSTDLSDFLERKYTAWYIRYGNYYDNTTQSRPLQRPTIFLAINYQITFGSNGAVTLNSYITTDYYIIYGYPAIIGVNNQTISNFTVNPNGTAVTLSSAKYNHSAVTNNATPKHATNKKSSKIRISGTGWGSTDVKAAWSGGYCGDAELSPVTFNNVSKLPAVWEDCIYHCHVIAFAYTANPYNNTKWETIFADGGVAGSAIDKGITPETAYTKISDSFIYAFNWIVEHKASNGYANNIAGTITDTQIDTLFGNTSLFTNTLLSPFSAAQAKTILKSYLRYKTYGAMALFYEALKNKANVNGAILYGNITTYYTASNIPTVTNADSIDIGSFDKTNSDNIVFPFSYRIAGAPGSAVYRKDYTGTQWATYYNDKNMSEYVVADTNVNLGQYSGDNQWKKITIKVNTSTSISQIDVPLRWPEAKVYYMTITVHDLTLSASALLEYTTLQVKRSIFGVNNFPLAFYQHAFAVQFGAKIYYRKSLNSGTLIDDSSDANARKYIPVNDGVTGKFSAPVANVAGGGKTLNTYIKWPVILTMSGTWEYRKYVKGNHEGESTAYQRVAMNKLSTGENILVSITPYDKSIIDNTDEYEIVWYDGYVSKVRIGQSIPTKLSFAAFVRDKNGYYTGSSYNTVAVDTTDTIFSYSIEWATNTYSAFNPYAALSADSDDNDIAAMNDEGEILYGANRTGGEYSYSGDVWSGTLNEDNNFILTYNTNPRYQITSVVASGTVPSGFTYEFKGNDVIVKFLGGNVSASYITSEYNLGHCAATNSILTLTVNYKKFPIYFDMSPYSYSSSRYKKYLKYFDGAIVIAPGDRPRTNNVSYQTNTRDTYTANSQDASFTMKIKVVYGSTTGDGYNANDWYSGAGYFYIKAALKSGQTVPNTKTITVTNTQNLYTGITPSDIYTASTQGTSKLTLTFNKFSGGMGSYIMVFNLNKPTGAGNDLTLSTSDGSDATKYTYYTTVNKIFGPMVYCTSNDIYLWDSYWYTSATSQTSSTRISWPYTFSSTGTVNVYAGWSSYDSYTINIEVKSIWSNAYAVGREGNISIGIHSRGSSVFNVVGCGNYLLPIIYGSSKGTLTNITLTVLYNKADTNKTVNLDVNVAYTWQGVYSPSTGNALSDYDLIVFQTGTLYKGISANNTHYTGTNNLETNTGVNRTISIQPLQRSSNTTSYAGKVTIS